jgi:hypothetical protein
MRKPRHPIERFPGFPPEPQTWNFPNIINGYVHHLTGGEFKVLWYILRHTYGWQKEIDAISLSQFERGIYSKRKNEWADRGTGLSRPTIVRALNSLQEKGFISKTTDKINTYQVVKNFNHPSKEIKPVASKKTLPTIFNDAIFNKQDGFDHRQTARKSVKFPEEWYTKVLASYQTLKGIALQGNEFQPVRQTIKTMFLSGRTPSEIADCMRFFQSSVEGDPSSIWAQWNINTVKMKLPEFLAGKLKG